MDKLNILLTGANGYIGRHIVSRLAELGHAVTACDLIFTDKHPEVKYVEYNILQNTLTICSRNWEPPTYVSTWHGGTVSFITPIGICRICRHISIF